MFLPPEWSDVSAARMSGSDVFEEDLDHAAGRLVTEQPNRGLALHDLNTISTIATSAPQSIAITEVASVRSTFIRLPWLDTPGQHREGIRPLSRAGSGQPDALECTLTSTHGPLADREEADDTGHAAERELGADPKSENAKDEKDGGHLAAGRDPVRIEYGEVDVLVWQRIQIGRPDERPRSFDDHDCWGEAGLVESPTEVHA